MNGNAIYTYDRLLLDFYWNTAIAIRADNFPNSQNMDSRANCHKRIAIDMKAMYTIQMIAMCYFLLHTILQVGNTIYCIEIEMG